MDRPSDADGGLDNAALTRRALLKRGGVGASALMLPGILAACGSSSSGSSTSSSSSASAAASGESPALTKLLDNIKSKEVIVANYGGDTEAARQKVFWTPFTERTKVTVISADAGALGDEMQEGEIPTRWDCFHGSCDEVYAALKLGKKPIDKLPQISWEGLTPAKYKPYMFQSFFVGYVPAYVAGTFKGDQPNSWADFFDTKKFPGKRAWPGVAYTSGTREAALMADGVPPDKVYPYDLERADAKIKSIFSDLVFYNEFPQAQSFLTSKEVVMSFGPNGLWHETSASGVKITVMWGATPLIEENGMNLMPDPPHLDAVTALAAFCNNPKLMAEFATMTSYGPPSQEAFKYLTKAQQDELPTAPGRKVLQENTAYVGSVENELAADNKKLFS
jgi:putative spermidine/putrescine transport system substrate-binding protein